MNVPWVIIRTSSCCCLTQHRVIKFSKAFDLIDHTLLIHKLKLYNIDTSWFSSYLNKRFQQTHYTDAISDEKEVIFKYAVAAICNSLCLLVKNATVNTFKSLKWKRLNGRWIISITTTTWSVFCIHLVNGSVFFYYSNQCHTSCLLYDLHGLVLMSL